MRSSHFCLVLALSLLAIPPLAEAGGCDACTTSAECVAIYGPGSLCVRWTATSPCMSTMQYCCPGQACAIQGDGRPSCEGDPARPCVVVEESSPDAGPPDAGTTTTPDAGTTATDAGTTARDAGAMDGGTTTTSRGGCGCRTSAGTSAVPAILVLGALLGIRRRRK
jgi:MYXO-CTERM domain-containing protein